MNQEMGLRQTCTRTKRGRGRPTGGGPPAPWLVGVALLCLRCSWRPLVWWVRNPRAWLGQTALRQVCVSFGCEEMLTAAAVAGAGHSEICAGRYALTVCWTTVWVCRKRPGSFVAWLTVSFSFFILFPVHSLFDHHRGEKLLAGCAWARAGSETAFLGNHLTRIEAPEWLPPQESIVRARLGGGNQ